MDEDKNDPNCHDVQATAELSEQDSEDLRHPPKNKMKNMIPHDIRDKSDECDPYDETEEMIAPNESKGKKVDGDMGSNNEHTLDAIEQDYELESEATKVVTTIANGIMDAEKNEGQEWKALKTAKLRNFSGT